MSSMLKFSRSSHRWWNKPLVEHDGEQLPAELVVLRSSLRPGEEGAWMNSRGRRSGVSGIELTADGRTKTVRRTLPDFVAEALGELYQEAGLSRGCPDLVIWNVQSQELRLVEVKCPHWDRPSHQQDLFMGAAARRRIPTEVVEWEFV
jgi:hypothetical protein